MGYHWACRIVPKDEDFVPSPEELASVDIDPHFTQKEVRELQSIICSNCALAHMCLKNWGFARDESKKKKLGEKVRKARLRRQQRERARAERTSQIKQLWRYCREADISLGRFPLVAAVRDDEDEEEGNEMREAKWHHHYPHTGQLPTRQMHDHSRWTWPVLFIYPSHNQRYTAVFCQRL